MLLLIRQQIPFKTGLLGLFLFLSSEFAFADITVGTTTRDVTANDITKGTNDPKLLFRQMIMAKSEIVYRGSLTHEQSGQLFSFSIDSSNNKTQGLQSLKSLSGPLKEYRYALSHDCDSVETPSLDKLSNGYNFYYRGLSRIAAREGHEILLLPVDQFRLGYSYVVDESTGLMLRSVAMLPDRTVLERTQFVDLVISPESVDRDLELEGGAAEKCAKDSSTASWKVGWAPEGFQLLRQTEEEGQISLIYGDGLSTFSLFIKPVAEALLPPGSVQRGATSVAINYYSETYNTYMVTFVGEVPKSVAERTLISLERDL